MTTNPSNSIQEAYFNYLYEIAVGRNKYLWCLCKLLHQLEFYSLVPHDDNRAEDGKMMRERYVEEMKLSRGLIPPSLLDQIIDKAPDALEGPCTVFEMLLGISLRMAEQLQDSPYAASWSICFWQLIKNLGLHDCGTREFGQGDAEEYVKSVIQKFLDRKFTKKGRGGLFPLQRTQHDQREVEIWYQMAEYLNENYDF